MKVDIEITEVLSRIITVDVESKEDAILKIEDMYKNEEIVLDYADFEGESSIEIIDVNN